MPTRQPENARDSLFPGAAPGGRGGVDGHGKMEHSFPSPSSSFPSFDQTSARAAEKGRPEVGDTRSSISTAMAEMNARPRKPSESEPGFAEEESGQSLAEMASADLDATLQLLADRAQYIAGASGAAIALRHAEDHNMVCRASAGSNAPELGALLSMNHGLSGACVRTRQALRCDDAQRDPRVNREVCMELGIASVVVMPIISGESVLGVFELFSGKPQAFDERDLSTLVRLSRMVETAVKHAAAAQGGGVLLETPAKDNPLNPAGGETSRHEWGNAGKAYAGDDAVEKAAVVTALTEKADVPEKPLFWSAAPHAQANARLGEEPPIMPASLKPINLQKCQVCEFPVSQGRTLCVECEEKKWRGQPELQQPIGSDREHPPAVFLGRASAIPVSGAAVAAGFENSAAGNELPASKTGPAVEIDATPRSEISRSDILRSEMIGVIPPDSPATHDRAFEDSAPFLSSALPSESWLVAHKYIFATLLVAAAIAAALAWLR